MFYCAVGVSPPGQPYNTATTIRTMTTAPLAERGLDISYETVRRWFLKFGSTIAANLHRTRPRPSDHWHLDESAPRRREGGAMS